LRELLARESDLEVVGEAGTGAETVEVVARTLPDVLVVDIAMPDVNGVEITRRVRACAPEVKILALSGHADRRSQRPHRGRPTGCGAHHCPGGNPER